MFFFKKDDLQKKNIIGKKFKKSDKSCVGIINILFKLN